MKYLWRNKLLLIILAIVILMFPTTISLPQQSRSENIVTAVGIDKVGEEYEITLQYLIPDASSGQNSLRLASLKGKSVADAMEKINLDFGKVSGFAHCRVLIFNDEAGNNDLFNELDYFQKIKVNANNILLVNTKDSAKDLLSAVENLNSDFYVILSRYSVEDKHNQYQALKTIGDYYNEMLGNNRTIAVNTIDLEKESGSAGESSGGSGGSGGSSSQGGDDKKSESSGASSGGGSSSSESSESKIKNDGKLCILKNNKIVETLSSDDSRRLNWFSKRVKDMTLEISGFSDDTYQNADMTFDIFKKKTKIKVDFVGGQPIYKLCVDVNASLVESRTGDVNKEEYKVNNRRFSDKLKGAIKAQILREMVQAEENFVSKKYDVVQCNEYFYKFKNKQYKDYIAKLSSKDDFLSQVKFQYQININQWN